MRSVKKVFSEFRPFHCLVSPRRGVQLNLVMSLKMGWCCP